MNQPADIASLVVALQQLVDAYPTDEDNAPRATLALESGDERHAVPLQPGQVEWLTTLIQNEAATCRNAHVGGNGECGHCENTPRGSKP
ncbi:hypothetical protein GCM10017744_103120 [Streptomyces antimycoticus]|uniref:Uncharacterized protein n=1 Tax=Streptomyces antimycoticus TaxID=68175 RepID=A0A4D4KR11_9ACTN|nr:hypothetical protein [Streptomyces antimycoticus]GDY49346.1 hypothetical protein SANT12839_102280 [Streptomyces antimycoticus]